MVSGLVTSPYDHDRIVSGDANWIRMAVNSEGRLCVRTGNTTMSSLREGLYG